jgi:ribosomal protein S27AE|tara:strand:- start:794 stop:1177 length:384 start_codon:yes stop_codon:yes gene_type:complete
MKLAIITALAFVLLIPISVFAQEPQSETIKEDSPIKYIVGIGLIFIIILAIIAGRYRKKFLAQSLASIGWTEAEKEKVRTRQDGKCAKCQKPPPARWEYYHIDGDRTNNSLDNCEGLCPNCYSIKTD